jgi:type IV secretion system protein VirB9
MRWPATRPMSRYGALGLLALVLSTASAETLPTKGTVDPRIRTATYNADEVYKLTGVVGYVIELIFEEGEVFTGKAGGDLEAVTIDGYQNQVHIKPKVAIVATNLIIYTNRRAYRVDYSASNRIPSRFSAEAIYAVRFSYPDSGKGSTATNQARIAAELAQADAHRPKNVDYWFCGRPTLKPLAASDDGIHTRLTFNARTELPAIFVRNDDGSESLLNFDVEEGDVVIHRVARQFILRRGRLTGCVVNKGFAGTGERLESGTLSPDVQRDRRDLRP